MRKLILAALFLSGCSTSSALTATDLLCSSPEPISATVGCVSSLTTRARQSSPAEPKIERFVTDADGKLVPVK